MTKLISFPHLDNYYIPIKYLIEKITKQKVLVAPKITRKTLELGAKYSPDFVCAPYKYNLGNYLESLELGANVLLQAGGGCRYGYYAELQEKTLKDLNYQFEFVNFIKNNHVSIIEIYKFAKKYNKKLNILTYAYYLLTTFIMILVSDKLSINIRENIGFEVIKGSYETIEKKFYNDLSNTKSIIKTLKLYRKYKKYYQNIKLNKPDNCIKVLIVGELYTIMEPNASCYIERTLAKMGVMVKRYTNLTYLLLTKKFKLPYHLKKSKKYIKYHLGADATESIAYSLKHIKEGYDGIIHLKSFGCTPEINAMPILAQISEDNHIPILYFSFDTEDNTEAIKTKLEAFTDMLKSNKYKDTQL